MTQALLPAPNGRCNVIEGDVVLECTHPREWICVCLRRHTTVNGRCQQLTPPESRKMCSFRKKSKNISCVFLLLFFYFFGKISWNFWFFGVTLGKISSRSSQPWRKNKKRKFFGLFLAGRNLWNFGATPYCKSEQTRLYHNSAKSARIGLRF